MPRFVTTLPLLAIALLAASCGAGGSDRSGSPLGMCMDRCRYDDGACMDAYASQRGDTYSCDRQLQSCERSCRTTFGTQTLPGDAPQMSIPE